MGKPNRLVRQNRVGASTSWLDGAAHKRLILSHHKNLNVGDYLIDDRPANGADKFTGEWIHFGQDPFPDWKSVTDYLIGKMGVPTKLMH